MILKLYRIIGEYRYRRKINPRTRNIIESVCKYYGCTHGITIEGRSIGRDRNSKICKLCDICYNENKYTYIPEF